MRSSVGGNGCPANAQLVFVEVLQFANFDACYLFNEAQNSRVVVPAVTVDHQSRQNLLQGGGYLKRHV